MGDGKRWGRKNMAGGWKVQEIDGAGKEMKKGKIKGRGRDGEGKRLGRGVKAPTPAEGMLEAEAMPESEAAATTTGEDSLAEAGVGLGAAGSGILQTCRRP
jgi:hypothetical protein